MKENITLRKARQVSKEFCIDMQIGYCQIYYVDILSEDNVIGEYIPVDPAHILILKQADQKIALLMHELTHHLDYCNYNSYGELNHSSKGYILAKKRVITWCKNNISINPNWSRALKCFNYDHEMRNFKL